jgi:hypothetical protein
LYQSLDIKNVNGVKTASTERAIADLLYFNPKMYFDAADFIILENIFKQLGLVIKDKSQKGL